MAGYDRVREWRLKLNPELNPSSTATEKVVYDDQITRWFIVASIVWGVVGMLLATPITAVMKILLNRFDGSRPLAELLAGRFGGVSVTTQANA